MRFLKKSVVLLATLLFSGCLILSTAYAQTTDPNEGSATFVADIISAAEQQGVQVIVINNGTSQEDKSVTNSVTEQTLPPGVLTPEDYENLSMIMAPASASALMKAQSNLLSFRELVKNKIEQVPPSFRKTIREIQGNSPTGEMRPFVRALYWSILLLAFGAWVEHEIYIKRLVARWLKSDLHNNPVGYLDKVPLLIKRALLKIFGVMISVAIAFTTGTVIFNETPPESIQFTIAVIYFGYVAIRLVLILWRMILAPYLSQYRIPHLSHTEALRLFHWLGFVSSMNIIILMISIWIGELGGRSDLHAVLASCFSFIVAFSNILMVIVNRKALSNAIRNGQSPETASGFANFLSKIWLITTVSYFAFSWMQLTYRVVLSKPLPATPAIAGAYTVLLATICVYALSNYFIERISLRAKRLVRLSTTEDDHQLPSHHNDPPESVESVSSHTTGSDESTADTTMISRHPLASYEDLARRVSGVLAISVGFWALSKNWRIDSFALYSNLMERSTAALIILFFGYIVYHLVRIWIDNKIEEEGADFSLAPGDEGGATSASRLATLLPLFRNFMLVVIGMSVVFSALLELGINVSPLFASAGVVGLAIGFGAQTLVRDIFSGAFYLFDDAFRRGEYVDIGSVKGTVEKISVRSFQLRHHLGPLHTIPFGEIQSLTNYSRDWVMMKLPLRLTYDTDPEKVRKLVKKLGIELMSDPELGDNFLQPLKSQGVIEMQDSAMIFRVKFMTKPGDQWTIRKRVYQEIRDLFNREGIQFANKEVTVRLAGDLPDKLDEKQARTVAAAAIDDEDTNDTMMNDDDR